MLASTPLLRFKKIPLPFSHKVSKWGYQSMIISLGLLTLILIIFVKARSGTLYWTSPMVILYTVFVTSFEISRICGAMFYKKMDKAIIKEGYIDYEPAVSIVIPCKNEEGAIRKTVEKCFAANYPKEKLEVIVINDGSTDKTGKILNELKLEYASLTVIEWKKNKGKRQGMAAGFKAANGEIVVQLDSDSYIDPATFATIVKPFAHAEVGAVCAHADPENSEENLLTKMQTAYYFFSFRVLKAAESTFMTVFCCSGCSSAYRKAVVAPILDTWLEEKFLGLPVTWGDDRSLTNWVLRRGYRTIYTDQVRALTIVPNNLKQFLKQQVRWKKGWFVNSLFASKFIYKHHPFVAFTYFFPLIIITLVTPFMATKALVYNPIVRGVSPLYYITGVLLVACLITLYYRYVARENKFWPYVFVWSGINLLFLSFTLFYAMATIQNRKWGTR